MAAVLSVRTGIVSNQVWYKSACKSEVIPLFFTRFGQLCIQPINVSTFFWMLKRNQDFSVDDLFHTQ